MSQLREPSLFQSGLGFTFIRTDWGARRLRLLFADIMPDRGSLVAEEPIEISWIRGYGLGGVSSEPQQQISRWIFAGDEYVLANDHNLPASFFTSPMPIATKKRTYLATVQWLVDGCAKLPRLEDYLTAHLNPKHRDFMLLLYTDEEYLRKAERLRRAAPLVFPRPGDVIGTLIPEKNILCAVEFASRRSQTEYEAVLHCLDPIGNCLHAGDILLAASGASLSDCSVLEAVKVITEPVEQF